jgi:hypothetical protein
MENKLMEERLQFLKSELLNDKNKRRYYSEMQLEFNFYSIYLKFNFLKVYKVVISGLKANLVR